MAARAIKARVFAVAKDGSTYQDLAVFGAYGGGPRNPMATLLRGNDGAFYGTTTGGGSNNLGTVFRFNEGGRDFQVVFHFGASGGVSNGSPSRAALMLGSDGAFYGTTSTGGDLGLGTVFRLLPPQTPELIGIILASGAAQVYFSGTSGYQYQVLRSTDLKNWTVLTSITMPPFGIYAHADNAPPCAAACYRAAWIPQPNRGLGSAK